MESGNWWDDQEESAPPVVPTAPPTNGNAATPAPVVQPVAPLPVAKKREPAEVEPGKYRILIRTGVLKWTSRKVEQMRRDMLREFHQMGAPNCEFLIVGLDGQPTEVGPEVALVLHLQCMTCTSPENPIEWYATKFTPCPKCAGKGNVKKKQMKKIPLPEGQSLVA